MHAGIVGNNNDHACINADGASCAQELTDTVAQCLKSMGYEVTVNLPFAGSSVKRSSDMRPVTLSSYSRLKIADNSV